MSEKKDNIGKLFHKLHQLQKRVARWIKNDHPEKVKEAEVKERKILNRIKADLKNSSKHKF